MGGRVPRAHRTVVVFCLLALSKFEGHISCENEEIVEIHICELRLMPRSRMLSGAFGTGSAFAAMQIGSRKRKRETRAGCVRWRLGSSVRRCAGRLWHAASSRRSFVFFNTCFLSWQLEHAGLAIVVEYRVARRPTGLLLAFTRMRHSAHLRFSYPYQCKGGSLVEECLSCHQCTTPA